MIAVDTNILVYAHRSDAPFHDVALQTMKALVEGDRKWAIPWPCVHEFLAKVTHPRIFKAPTPLERALFQIDEWLRSPVASVLAEPEGYFQVLESTLAASKVIGSRIHDARIAAICTAHGVTVLWSVDRDFERFRGLRAENPLAA